VEYLANGLHEVATGATGFTRGSGVFIEVNGHVQPF
jgi:hypothetical protein